MESKKAASVQGENLSPHDPGALLMFAEVRPGQSLEQVRDTMIDVVEGLKSHPVTAEEVDRAKRKILKERELSANDSQRLALELSEWSSLGDWRLYFLHRDRIEAVTPEQVNAAAETYLLRSNRTLGVYVPTESPSAAPVPATPELLAMIGEYKGRTAITEGEAVDVSPEGIEAKVSADPPRRPEGRPPAEEDAG